MAAPRWSLTSLAALAPFALANLDALAPSLRTMSLAAWTASAWIALGSLPGNPRTPARESLGVNVALALPMLVLGFAADARATGFASAPIARAGVALALIGLLGWSSAGLARSALGVGAWIVVVLLAPTLAWALALGAGAAHAPDWVELGASFSPLRWALDGLALADPQPLAGAWRPLVGAAALALLAGRYAPPSLEERR